MSKVITVNARGALTLPREVRDKLGVTLNEAPLAGRKLAWRK